MVLIILLWASAAWITFGVLSTIALIGKPRKPTTPGIAIATVITAGVVIFSLVSAAIALA